jgi:hypothetical protein
MKTAWSEKRRFVFLPTFRFIESEYRMAIKGLEDPREEKFYDVEAEVYKGYLIPQGKKINIPDIFENIVWLQIFNIDNDEKTSPYIKKIITKRGDVINLSTEGNAFVDQIFVCNMVILFPDYYEPDDEENDEEELD